MENNRPLGWTTLEEAKKLIEAGLDPNTADMCYQIMGNNGDRTYVSSALTFSPEDDDIPCWSLGALKNIVEEYFGNDLSYQNGEWNVIVYDKFSGYKFFAFEEMLELVNFCLEENYIKKSEEDGE